LVNSVIVATDLDDIFQKCKGAEMFSRSKESSTDEASSEIVLIEFAKTIQPEDVIVFIQATSPLVDVEELDTGIKQVLNEGYDSSLSVVRQKRFIWNEDGTPTYNIHKRPRRQEWDGFLVENGAFYISRAKGVIENSCRLYGKVGMVECSPETYLEIDEPEDWFMIETLIQQKKQND